MTRIFLSLLLFQSVVDVAAPVGTLTPQQVSGAIALGKTQKVPILRVGSFLGDFDVEISGPVARVALAAASATKDYKPFDESNVTPEMTRKTYRVRLHRSRDGRSTSAKRIVLQPKGAKGLDGVIQPIQTGDWEATFDRLPDGEFQVVVVTYDAPQKYTVTAKDRQRIQ